MVHFQVVFKKPVDYYRPLYFLSMNLANWTNQKLKRIASTPKAKAHRLLKVTDELSMSLDTKPPSILVYIFTGQIGKRVFIIMLWRKYNLTSSMPGQKRRSASWHDSKNGNPWKSNAFRNTGRSLAFTHTTNSAHNRDMSSSNRSRRASAYSIECPPELHFEFGFDVPLRTSGVSKLRRRSQLRKQIPHW